MFPVASITCIEQLLKKPAWIYIIVIVLEAISLCIQGIKCFKYIHCRGAVVNNEKDRFCDLRKPLNAGKSSQDLLKIFTESTSTYKVF